MTSPPFELSVLDVLPSIAVQAGTRTRLEDPDVVVFAIDPVPVVTNEVAGPRVGGDGEAVDAAAGVGDDVGDVGVPGAAGERAGRAGAGLVGPGAEHRAPGPVIHSTSRCTCSGSSRPGVLSSRARLARSSSSASAGRARAWVDRFGAGEAVPGVVDQLDGDGVHRVLAGVRQPGRDDDRAEQVERRRADVAAVRGDLPLPLDAGDARVGDVAALAVREAVQVGLVERLPDPAAGPGDGALVGLDVGAVDGRLVAGLGVRRVKRPRLRETLDRNHRPARVRVLVPGFAHDITSSLLRRL